MCKRQMRAGKESQSNNLPTTQNFKGNCTPNKNWVCLCSISKLSTFFLKSNASIIEQMKAMSLFSFSDNVIEFLAQPTEILKISVGWAILSSFISSFRKVLSFGRNLDRLSYFVSSHQLLGWFLTMTIFSFINLWQIAWIDF